MTTIQYYHLVDKVIRYKKTNHDRTRLIKHLIESATKQGVSRNTINEIIRETCWEYKLISL